MAHIHEWAHVAHADGNHPPSRLSGRRPWTHQGMPQLASHSSPIAGQCPPNSAPVVVVVLLVLLLLLLLLLLSLLLLKWKGPS